jgi:hypothetical protein
MWKNVIDLITNNGFKEQENKEKVFHNELVFKNPQHKGLIIKVYEGRVYLGVCFNATHFSFTSIVRYKGNNEPYLSVDGYNNLLGKFPIIENIVSVVLSKKI